MNFISRNLTDSIGPRIMKGGDLVIIYERHDSLDHFYLSSGTILNNKYGHFYHDDFIGKPFGSKVLSRTSKGYMYALEPSPELWSLAVHTRTQIVNELDSSCCILNMDVFPGCVVVESGTGSGCMTLALARAVAPNGHVYTFEYNDTRAKTAREEFKRLGVDHLITVTCRDVCGKFAEEEKGFLGVPDQSADAVFLDLPEPWLPMNDVLRVLKPGRTLCTYSPCIEQIIKTCEKLREENFHTVRMLEVRQIPYDGRRVPYEEIDFGLDPNIVTRVNSNKDRNGLRVAAAGAHSNSSTSSTTAAATDATARIVNVGDSKKRKAEEEAEVEEDDGDVIENQDIRDDGKTVTTTSMVDALSTTDIDALEEGGAVGGDNNNDNDDEDDGTGTGTGSAEDENKPSSSFLRFADMNDEQKAEYFRARIRYIAPVMASKEHLIARPLTTMKGHTAFLTFSVRPSIATSTTGTPAATASSSSVVQ